MKHLHLLILPLTLLALAAPAQAQNGDAALLFENWNGTGTSGDSITFALRTDVAISGPVGLQADLSFRDHTIGGATSDTLNGTLHGYWEDLTPSINKVGVFASISDHSSASSGTTDTYGVEAIFDLAAFASIEIWAGSGVGPITDNFDVAGIEAVFPVGGLELFTRLNDFDALNNAEDATDVTLGLDWDVGPGTVTASIGTAEVGGQNADRIGLGFTLPFGGGTGNKRNPFFEAARGAYRY